MQRAVPRQDLRLLAVLTLVPACAMTWLPPARTTGPSVSREGVQVAVLAQVCAQADNPEDSLDEDHADLQVRVEVHNAAADQVTAYPERFRLVAPGEEVLKPVTWSGDDSVPLQPNETRSFRLRFLPFGWRQCHLEMRLESSDGVTLGGKALRIGVITFVAWKV